MCAQCVANSVPYVGMAVGGLRVMSWQARRRRLTPAATAAPAPPERGLDHVRL